MIGRKKKVVIIGAGVTGLSAAWKLSENEFDVEVFEKEKQVGGLATSIKRDGCIFDYGPHGFLLPQNLKKEFHKILKEEKINIIRKNVKIKFKDKYFTYPLETIDVLMNINPIISFRYFVDLIWAMFKREIFHPEEKSAEEWFINRFGKSFYRMFFENYTEKVWGIHPCRLSSSFTESRVPLIKFWEVFKKTVSRGLNYVIKKDIDLSDSYSTKTYYPRGGAIRFSEEVTKKVREGSGRIHFNSSVNKINIIDNKLVSLTYLNKDNREYIIPCDYVISTMPINELILCMRPKPAESIIKAANFLKFRSIVYVNLIIHRDSIFDVQWIYFRDKTYNRVCEMSKFGKELFPEGKTGLCAEITCDEGDEIWNAKPEELSMKIIKELEEEKFITADEVEDFFITKSVHGYPVSTVGFEAHLDQIMNYISNIDNLITTGRQGLFRYLQMDHCMEEGISAAEKIKIKEYPITIV